jgi:hypothetical protein
VDEPLGDLNSRDFTIPGLGPSSDVRAHGVSGRFRKRSVEWYGEQSCERVSYLLDLEVLIHGVLEEENKAFPEIFDPEESFSD